jgi:MoxR-like ATPase
VSRRTKKQTLSPPPARPAAEETAAPVPSVAPSVLTRPLGLEGWAKLEPVVLAALISGDPLLLIGKHGTAKSFLLERLAEALGLTFRFYNASLVNYDDLVGIPVPDESQTSLRYISTPSSIWGAEVVFIDEISRARPELQNKLFPIIHERRVQGVALDRLQYRWSAMNPPPGPDEDDGTVYHGAEPLDPALADRFAFIIEVPGWNELDDAAKRLVLLDQFRGRHEFPVPVTELVARGKQVFAALGAHPPTQLADYLIGLLPLAAKAGHDLSTRRATTLLRSILAVQAARTVLAKAANLPAPEWEDAAWLAFRHGLPGTAHGAKTDAAALLAAHRQAWRLCGLENDDPWRRLLAVADPAERLALACDLAGVIEKSEFAGLITNALATQKERSLRAALALVSYLRLRDGTDLPAIAVETLAAEAQRALSPAAPIHNVYGSQLDACRQVSMVCATFPEGDYPDKTRDQHCRNLLHSLLPDGFGEIKAEQVREQFNAWWKTFRLPC